MISLFSQKPAHDPATVGRLKQWTRELLGLDEDVVLTLMQHECGHDHEAETIVGVLEQGNPRKFSVPRPLAEVTREDLMAALRKPIRSTNSSEVHV